MAKALYTRLLMGALTIVAWGCGGPRGWGAVPRQVTLGSLDRPFELPVERCGDYFIAQASINGGEPISLILDTGAGNTHLDPALARRLGLRDGVDSLSLGDFTARGVHYEPLDMTPFSGALGREVHGILGHPVFGSLTLTWDFPAGRLTVSTDTLPAEGPGIVTARRNPRPFVRSAVGTDTLWVLIDTGSSWGLTLRDPARLRLASPLRVTGARVRADGVHLTESGRIDGVVRVGPLRLADPVVNNAVGVDLVGQDVLRHFRITFDGRTGRIRFERPDAPVETPVTSAAVPVRGFALIPDLRSARVWWVDDAAHEAGLREGDEVVAVNGVPWAERGCPAAGEAPAVSSVRFRVRRDGQEFEVTVPVGLAHENQIAWRFPEVFVAN